MGKGKRWEGLERQERSTKVVLNLKNIEPEAPDWKKIRTTTAKTSQTEHPEGASKVYGRSNATGRYK
jgi:hypothetical protein